MQQGLTASIPYGPDYIPEWFRDIRSHLPWWFSEESKDDHWKFVDGFLDKPSNLITMNHTVGPYINHLRLYSLALAATELVLMISGYYFMRLTNIVYFAFSLYVLALPALFAYAYAFQSIAPAVMVAVASVAHVSHQKQRDLFKFLIPFDFQTWVTLCRLQAFNNFVGFMSFSVSVGRSMAFASSATAPEVKAFNDAAHRSDFNAGIELLWSWRIAAVFTFARVVLLLLWTLRFPGSETDTSSGKLPLRRNIFGNVLFDGEVAMMLSEAVGMTFMQKLAIKYRRGRVIQRQKAIMGKDTNEEKRKEAKSQLDITMRMLTQMLFRYLFMVCFQNGFLMSVQCNLLLLRHNYGTVDWILAVSIFSNLSSGVLSLFDIGGIWNVYKLTRRSCDSLGFYGPSLNNVCMRHLMFGIIAVLMAALCLFGEILFYLTKLFFSPVCSQGILTLTGCIPGPQP
jgi:hypothetical protein